VRILRWIILIVLAGVAAIAHASTPAPASAPNQPSGPDIIGLRLGMTESQIVAVLRAYNPAVQFRRVVDTLPTPAATRFTTTLYAAVFGDDGAGVGDELIKVEFTNPTPVSRALGIWRKQSFPPGHELTVENTLAAFREKYGAPDFTFTGTNRMIWAWAAGVGGRKPQSFTYCMRPWGDPVEQTNLSIVVNTFIEPRAYSNTPDCGVSIDMGVHDAGGLVPYISTALIDHPATVRAREELDEMSKRPDLRPVEAEQRGKPKL
jgi:hypothetical protein